MMKNTHRYFLGLMAVGLLGTSGIALATDLSGVPGVVIRHRKLGSYGFSSAPSEFLADPEILVLANGDYIAACALAGSGTSADSSGETSIYISHDKGVSWSALGGTLSPILRGSFIEHNSALYLIGANHYGSSRKLTVWKSTNNGANWTSSVTSINAPDTPNNPVIYNNRVFSASGRSTLTASTSADWMTPSSWSFQYGYPALQSDWRSGSPIPYIGEGQMVASPSLGVFVLPKVNDKPLLSVASVNGNNGVVSFDPDHDFADFPGGEKKFGAAYDAVSGKFYAISNPILAVDKGDDAPNMIRNTAAMLSSANLRNWNVEKIFQYSPVGNDQGFCYPNFDFDGTNMVIATRAAYKVDDGRDPRRAHDSNLLVFNMIEDFRNAVPDQYLKLSGGDVLRYERTEDADAPLGSFALGAGFAGSPLTNPNGFGQDTHGDVFIRESGGRILRFDAGGNFIETTNSSPVAFQTSNLDVDQPVDFSTWTKSGSGDWSVSENWLYWCRADTKEEIAVFGSAASVPSTITAHDYLFDWSLKGLRFINSQPYTLAGDNRLMIESASGESSIELQEGSHEIKLPVILKSETDFSAQSGESLTISSNYLNVAVGQDLNMNSGLLSLENSAFLIMDGGSLVMDGGEISFSNSAVVFDGVLEFKAPENFTPESGNTYQVLEGAFYEGLFGQVVLPTLEDGLGWDDSALYTSGEISVILKAPEDWMAQYGLPADGSADFIDSDGDTQDNYSEWRAGTNPTNALSYFDFDPSGTMPVENGIQLRWNSLTNRTYRIELGTNLLDSPPFTLLQSGIPGEDGVSDFIDTSATNREQSFYRVYVE